MAVLCLARSLLTLALARGALTAAVALLLGLFSLLFGFLLLLDECAEDTDLVVAVAFEVEIEFLPEPQLQQVVIERLLGDADLLCGVLE